MEVMMGIETGDGEDRNTGEDEDGGDADDGGGDDEDDDGDDEDDDGGDDEDDGGDNNGGRNDNEEEEEDRAASWRKCHLGRPGLTVRTHHCSCASAHQALALKGKLERGDREGGQANPPFVAEAG